MMSVSVVCHSDPDLIQSGVSTNPGCDDSDTTDPVISMIEAISDTNHLP